MPTPYPTHLINKEAEYACLASILLDKVQAEYRFEQLNEKYFVDPVSKTIYLAMAEAKNRELNFDILAIISANQNIINIKDILLECIGYSSLTTSYKQTLALLINAYMAREAYKLGKSIVEYTKNTFEGQELAKLLQPALDEYNERIDQKENVLPIQELLPKWINSFQEAEENNSKPYFLNIEGLHQYFLKTGHLASIVARTKSGKSSMLGQIIVDALNQDRPVFLATLEVSDTDFLEKIVAYKSDLNPIAVQNFKSNNNQSQIKAIGETVLWLEKKQFETYHTANCFISELVMRVKEFAKTNPNPIVIIDQLQFINSGRRFENKIGEYDFIMQKLKAVAFETQSMIFVAHQLNRDVERAGRTYPQTSDIKDCGRIEEISDLVIMFAKSNEKDDETRYATIISRHRTGGRLELKWIKERARFAQTM
jgi:replicative DNA helicase